MYRFNEAWEKIDTVQGDEQKSAIEACLKLLGELTHLLPALHQSGLALKPKDEISMLRDLVAMFNRKLGRLKNSFEQLSYLIN